MKKQAGLFLLSCGALFSASAFAHFPIMSCWSESEQIVCHAGYSDGSTAVDYDIHLYDYDDTLIAKETTDKGSKVRFSKPDTDFYIVFDAGHENPVEVDVVEIKEK